MFNWLKLKEQARIEELERQLAGRDEQLRLAETTRVSLINRIQKDVAIIMDQEKQKIAHDKQDDTIALALGQTGKPFCEEKVYLIQFLNGYYPWKEVSEIVNNIYETNHSPDTIRKAAKRGI